MELTRRRLLSAATGAAVAGVLAGCTGGAVDDSGPESDGPAAQASFFVFGDIAARVAGDAATAELLVPVGQHTVTAGSPDRACGRTSAARTCSSTALTGSSRGSTP